MTLKFVVRFGIGGMVAGDIVENGEAVSLCQDFPSHFSKIADTVEVAAPEPESPQVVESAPESSVQAVAMAEDNSQSNEDI